MLAQEQSFLDYSDATPFPGSEQAAYQDYFDDPQAQDIPDAGLDGRDPYFDHNLALHVNDQDLDLIGNTLSDMINKDISDRQQWVNIIRTGINYLGIGGQRSKTSSSTRNTDIYSSTLLTIALRVTSKIHSTLFPANGFVSTQIKGLVTEELENRANRIKEFFNYFFSEVAEEYVPDKKQAILWMVLDGSVFSKVYFDRLKQRPCGPYVCAEEVIINSSASSLEDAERITHEFILTDREYKLRVEAGEYRNCHLENAPDLYSNPIKQTTDYKTGINALPDDRSKTYQIHESICYLDLKGFEHLDKTGKPSGRPLPYIVTKDKNSNSVLAIRRNWNEMDPKFKLKNYYVQYKYFTGFNIYGFGLFHLLLGYAKAETELQQQLLKAVQLANAPVMLQASGARSEKTQIEVSPGLLTSIASFGADFNSSLRPLGFHDPSPIAIELKKMLTESMEQLSVARQISPDNIPQNTSATTMLGVLSTMHILEDSLMNDLYTSFKKELSLFYGLFGEWVPEEPYPFAVEGGDYVIMADDFKPCIAIKPTLDPSASSQTFQLIINDSINTLAQQNPDLYDVKEIHKRMLKAMKVSNPDELFKKEEHQEPPAPMDPISESKAAMLGQPIKAYKWQDQQSYITIESSTLAQLQADESQDHSKSMAILQEIIQERKAMQYVAQMEAKIGRPIADDPAQIPPEMQNQIALIAAQKLLQEQQEQAEQNPPPIDPSKVLMEENRIKEKSNDAKEALDARKLQLEEMKLTKEMQSMQHEQVLREMEQRNIQAKTEAEIEIQKMKMQAEIERLKLEQVKIQIAQQEAGAKLQLEERNANLQAETKAFDSTLRFEKESTTGVDRDENLIPQS